jgi:drug/metabolite transporter (DMT)-like permease
MNGLSPGLWGSFTALGWGASDFIARFTGRAAGHQSALFGMLLTGSIALTLIVFIGGIPLTWAPGGLWLLGASGLCIMLATLWLYRGLAAGPISIVSPIVGAYPALVVLLAVIFGARPSPLQWGAMALTMAGVVVVARSAGAFEEIGKRSRAELRVTVIVSLLSAVGFALGVYTAQQAVPIYGNLQTLWVSRVVSLCCLILVFLKQRARPVIPGPWWPLIALQGMIDTSGYLFLYEGSYGEDAEIAAVTASAFGAVTTILARIFLKERMPMVQWAGIGCIFAGVAVLSA